MQIDRVSALSVENFRTEYMLKNRPVLVTDALRDWHLREVWTPEYLVQHLGHERVQVYNRAFELKSLVRLSSFLNTRFNRSDPVEGPEIPHVRWYTRLRDVQFCWADEAFERLSRNWSMPYFLPATDYAFPFCPAPRRADPTLDHFPAKGLFLSERGAVTGLHVEPWGSDALYCQLYGTSSWLMYSPDQEPYLCDGAEIVDLAEPDRERFPLFDKAHASHVFLLHPGDVIYVPHGWYHHARSESDSISLTWNFVHRWTLDEFFAWLGRPKSRVDRDVLLFFFGAFIEGEVTPAAVERLVWTHFGQRSRMLARRQAAQTLRPHFYPRNPEVG